jgi:hypothetical protein
LRSGPSLSVHRPAGADSLVIADAFKTANPVEEHLIAEHALTVQRLQIAVVSVVRITAPELDTTRGEPRCSASTAVDSSWKPAVTATRY